MEAAHVGVFISIFFIIGYILVLLFGINDKLKSLDSKLNKILCRLENKEGIWLSEKK